MKKNILFISDSSLKNPIVQSQGLPYLSQLDKNNFSVYFVSFEDSADQEANNDQFDEIKRKFNSDIKFIQLVISKDGIFPKWFNFILRSTWQVVQIVKKNQIDLIHARSFFPALIGVLVKYVVARKPKVIYDNRGLYIDEHIYAGRIKKNSVKEKIFRWLENVIYKKCDFVVVVSNQFWSHLSNQKKIPFNIISKKIEVIPNRTRIYFNEQEIFENKAKTEEFVECVYSGSLADWQGTQLFNDIFKSLHRVFPNIRFKILTYEEHLLPNLPKPLSELNERIRVLSIPPEKVAEELITSNFGLLLRPNHILSKVCSPIKFTEYLASGIPLLLNEGIGDTEEIIKKFKVGLIIKNRDFETAGRGMKLLLQDEKIYSRCIQVAKEEFDIETSFKQYEKIYNSLLN